MSCDDCEDRSGALPGRCRSEDVATSLVDSSGDVLDSVAGEDYSECQPPSPCCSHCQSPDVTSTVDTTSSEWELAFDIGGITTFPAVTDAGPIIIFFRIYPGADLPYMRVWFESLYSGLDAVLYEHNPDQDEPEEGVIDWDEFFPIGSPILPTTDLSPSSSTGGGYYIVLDPAGTSGGTTTGGTIYYGPPGETPAEQPIEIEVSDPSSGNAIRFASAYQLFFNLIGGGASEQKPFTIEQSVGTDDIYWTLTFVEDVSGTAVTLSSYAGTFTVGVRETMLQCTANPAGMIIANEPYTGKLKLKGWTDAAYTIPVNGDDTRPDDTLNVMVRIDQEHVYLDVAEDTDPVDRGATFGIVLTAKNSATGDVVKAFDPDTIELALSDSTDTNDVITPVVNNVAFSQGIYTIPGAEIDGGGPGGATHTIQANAPAEGISGSSGITVSPIAWYSYKAARITIGGAWNFAQFSINGDGTWSTLVEYSPPPGIGDIVIRALSATSASVWFGDVVGHTWVGAQGFHTVGISANWSDPSLMGGTVYAYGGKTSLFNPPTTWITGYVVFDIP